MFQLNEEEVLMVCGGIGDGDTRAGSSAESGSGNGENNGGGGGWSCGGDQGPGGRGGCSINF
ncbi:hypothetical protein GCM10007860_25770 [Chitiniphilus shinanonensis]|uniref:Uncharacterized protein n=1 Tax=Chitiniphilus shinanonensis TaxID=553088 RepID=A0ABQ6C0B5_9NEIS|nr:hypothetical protein GCM10007860_25770 [Chitiniphilus shinanonensis]